MKIKLNFMLFDLRKAGCSVLIALISTVIMQKTFGQTYNQTIDLKPPAPEAASLMKFTEVPVSYYTGLANTSIPLFTINTGSLVIPIDISYHGRGILVEEIASRVGMGWALNYGGAISRQIRGLPDDGVVDPNHFYKTIFTDNNLANTIQSSDVDLPHDFEPDMYMFNIPGASGKFMWNPRTGLPLMQSYSNVRIEPVVNDLQMQGMILTDQEGNKYYFGLSKDKTISAYEYEDMDTWTYNDINQHTPPPGPTQQDRPITTWQLVEIETTSNEKITFTYDSELQLYHRRLYDKFVYDEHQGDYTEPRRIVHFYGRISSYAEQISEINFPNGKIKFTPAQAEREDLQAAHALQKVELFDKNNKLVKGYSFQQLYHSAFVDNNYIQIVADLYGGTAKKRLFLHSLQETGAGGITNPPYLFTYSPISLPNRFSTAQDIWGYYNGKNNGGFLTFFNYRNTPVDRTVDATKNEAGLLTKITYPTGGTVSFTYEQNKGVPPVFMNQLFYPNPNPTENVPVLDGFLKHPQYFDGVDTYSKEFRVGEGVQGGVTFNFQCLQSSDPAICNYQAYIEGEGQNLFVYPGNPPALNLAPGTYRIKVIAGAGHNPSDPQNAFNVTVSWMEKRNLIDPSESNLLLAGGKRIQKIEYKDPNNVVKVKTFEYINPATGKSSGVIIGLPNFYFIQGYYRDPGGQVIPIIDKYGSLPGSPLTRLQGNSLGYSHVTETFGDATSNIGKIEYQFTVTEDGGEYYKFPYHLPIDNEWLRGKLLNKKVYEKISTPPYLFLQKETINKYAYGGLKDATSIFFKPFVPMGQNHVYNVTKKNFYLPLIKFYKLVPAPNSYLVYYQTGGTMDLYSTTEKEYAKNQVVSGNTTEFFFNYENHYQSIRSESLNSKGDKVIRNSYYPPDLNPVTDAEQKLKNLNRISTPVKIETVVEQKNTSTVLSKTTNYTKYKEWTPGIITPELSQSAYSGTAPLQTDVQYFSYDAFGHPTELMEKEGPHVVYLWGYNSQYPVAKVIGSDYNTVAAGVDFSMLNNAHQYTDQQLRDHLNLIRTRLANTNAMVITYTYKPLVGVTSETDASGKTTYYDYDGMGRLVVVRDHDKNVVKRFSYNYAATDGQQHVYQNEPQSRSFTRNNCGTATPTTEIYEVPVGRYTSLINVEDANKKALEDIEANGQNYANTHGHCMQTVYATITAGRTTTPEPDGNCLNQYKDITVRFYRDAAHTIPYSVSNLVIQIKTTATPYSNNLPSPSTTTTTNYTCNGTEFTLAQQLVERGCSQNCPQPPCLPTPNDPRIVYSYSLVASTFTIEIL